MRTLVISFGTLLICCLATANAWAKPRSMAVDTTFDRCGWAAEVTIIAVGDAIRVRVTESADAIFRGRQLLGKTVDVKPIGAGEQACCHDLQRFAGTQTKLLMVADQDDAVQLVGSPETVNNAPGYHLRTWFDFNATWFYSNDKKFGRPVGDQFDGVYAVTTSQLSARFAPERKQLMLALAEILLRPRVDLPEADLTKLILQLGDDEFYVRERAQRELLTLDPSVVEFLEMQSRTSDDLEIVNRLRQVIRAIESPLQRHALEIREQGAAHEARVLIAAFDVAGDAKMKSAIVSRLRTLADSDEVEVNDTSSTAEAIIAAWRKTLK